MSTCRLITVIILAFIAVASRAANLIQNPGFQSGADSSYVPSAGAAAGTFATNLPGTWTGVSTGTALGPTVIQRVRGMGQSGTHGDYAAIVSTRYQDSGLQQAYSTGGNFDVYFRADVYVVRGRVKLGVGTAAQLSATSATETLGEWVRLSGTGTVQGNGGQSFTQVFVGSDDTSGATFFVDNVTVEIVLPPVQSLTLNPPNVLGGRTSTGNVSIGTGAPAGGITVLLSDDSAFASAPASVTIAQFQVSANFTVNTTSVTTSQTCTVTAQIQTSSKTATLGIHPAPPLQSVSVSPTSVDGYYSAQGTVTLAAPAPATTAVTLTDSSNYASVPASVNVGGGATSGFFTVSTTGPPANRLVTITASLGAVSKTTTLLVRPQHVIQTFLVTPATHVGGTPLATSVTMDRPAANPFLQVSLTPDKPSVFTGSLTIFGGSATANGSLGTLTVTTATVVTITARYGQSTRTQTVTLTP